MPNTPPPAVTGLYLTPDSDTARFCHVDANVAGVLATAIGGLFQALDLDHDTVMWLDEDGKNKGLTTNLLATKIAHRLHAGLYPDDTINGPALLLGERLTSDGEPVSADLGANAYAALRDLGVEIHAQASQEVLLAAGGAEANHLSHWNSGGGCMVTTQQVDATVYVVGQDDFTVGVYTTEAWLGEADDEPGLIEAEDASAAWKAVQSVRTGCTLHRCEPCESVVFVSEHQRVEALRCATCGARMSATARYAG